jgi:hypothetical protein
MSRFSLPSPALVIAVLALFVAIGGTSYAVIRLPAKSVGTVQLKNKAVTNPKLATNAVKMVNLADGAVQASKLASNSVDATKVVAGSIGATQVGADALTGAQINESTLGELPAAGIAGLQYRSHSLSIPAGMVGTSTLTCDSGSMAIAGGVEASHDAHAVMIDSHPVGGGWQSSAANLADSGSFPVTIWAVCAKPAPGGGTTANVRPVVSQFRPAR